ncbi:ATP-binding cassette domain-containing protein [Altererythrobacter aestuarii]|uniref:ATP-binding cassette domain-containing protein n=2 Tax=Alteraurantiacibacter aestuarii TaxID=650004 RepID=A0A844ZLI1_9SPHN|nr:ATP-binding cassette domain-containing protein [Alteraurantiacibacter aestuarii]
MLAKAREYRGSLVLIALLATGESLAMLALPWLAGNVLGDVVAAQAQLANMGVGLLIIGLIAISALHSAAAILSASTSGKILADLRNRTHAHVQSLPIGFHDRSRQGDLLALMTYEVTLLSSFLSSTLARAPAMLITGAGATILLFMIDPMLALFIPLIIPGFFLLMKIGGRRIRRLGERSRDAEATVFMTAERQLAILPAIKSFAIEERQDAVYADHVEQARQLQFHQARVDSILGPAVGLLAGLGIIALIVFGMSDLTTANRTPADMFRFLLYAALLTRPVGALADFYGRYQWAAGTLARLEALLGEKAEPGYALAGDPGAVRGAIRFEDVSFAYPGRRATLSNIDLDIKAGEIVALTGENGAGKSTLISLLQQFYVPDAGRILLDGQDISTFQVQALRRQIALVPQRALLFDGTVRDNIALALDDPHDQRIEQAVQLAQADEFIAELPDGYETWIGDNGVRLSGGQRQRIALARALVLNPPILIMDEATSMYDLEAELALVEECQTALAGRTVILVTHRPASLALANRIIRLDHGRITTSDPG